MLFLVLFLSALAVASATYGVDVSAATSQSSFECMKNNGYKFAVVRVYRSSGAVDTNGPSSINHAWNAGMSHVDGYIFPCYSCGNPAKQMDDTIDYLASHGVQLAQPGELPSARNGTVGAAKVGMLWLDIEGSSYWSTTPSNNVHFVSSMVSQAKTRGVNIGIYSSASQWSPIMNGATDFHTYPLWYAHYDSVASFSDFKPFGGWNTPAIKQFAGTTSLCSVSVDKNYY